MNNTGTIEWNMSAETVVENIVRKAYKAAKTVCEWLGLRSPSATGSMTAARPAENEQGYATRNTGSVANNPTAVAEHHVDMLFTPGQVVTARVRQVTRAGVYFSIQGANDVILPMKHGKCSISPKDVKNIFHVGEYVRLEVKAWYPQNRQLVLSQSVEEAGTQRQKSECVSRSGAFQRKPDYEKLPEGTTVLIDGANLLGCFAERDAKHVLECVVDELKRQGYAPKVFLEQRSWRYYDRNQESEAASKDFEDACYKLGVTYVSRESDLAILQMLKASPKAVGLTRDRYADYAKAFPKIVGTRRIRGFSVSEIDGNKLVMVDGLVDAIVIQGREGTSVDVHDDGIEEDSISSTERIRSFTEDVSSGFCGRGSTLLKEGKTVGAQRCFAKAAAHRNANGFAGLAEISLRGGDAKRAAKYEDLCEKLERRVRDQEIRRRRLAAERRRNGARSTRKCA